MVKVSEIKLDEINILRILVADQNGEMFDTMKEHLCAPSNPNIGWISSSVPECQNASRDLIDKEIEPNISPSHLSLLQQEFLSLCK